MSKWFKFGLVGILVFGAMAVLITGAALAQDSTPTSPTTPDNTAPVPWGRGFGRGLGGQVGLDAAAQALGMTTDELTAQLWAGKTLATIAEEKGVDLVELQATVQAAVQAAQESTMRDAINQAVQDGIITQENADWLLEGLDKGFLTHGLGFGFEFGGRGGFHERGFKNFAPPADSAPQVSPSGGA